MQLTGASQSLKGAILAASSGFFVAGSGAGGMADVGEMQIGEYTGTGSALDVPLDFVPTFVFVINTTTGTAFGIGINSATNGTKSYKQVTTAGLAAIAAQGILFTANTKKFSLGTDGNLNANASVYQFVAFGS